MKKPIRPKGRILYEGQISEGEGLSLIQAIWIIFSLVIMFYIFKFTVVFGG